MQRHIANTLIGLAVTTLLLSGCRGGSGGDNTAQATPSGGYRIYYGQQSHADIEAPTIGNGYSAPYQFVANVEGMEITHHKIALPGGIWFFRITTYHDSGYESYFSEEISVLVRRSLNLPGIDPILDTVTITWDHPGMIL